MTANTSQQPLPIAGYFGFAMGASALLLVLVHFWIGPISPQQRVSITVGKVAAEMRQAAIRKLRGTPQPAPVAAKWNADRILQLIAALLAGLALVAGAASLVRREAWRPAAAGIGLGAGAVAFQFFVWSILVLAGALIIYAIINNIPGILGE